MIRGLSATETLDWQASLAREGRLVRRLPYALYQVPNQCEHKVHPSVPVGAHQQHGSGTGRPEVSST